MSFEEDPEDVPEAKPMKRRKGIGDDPGIRMLLPVGRSGWAIASGYLALFSVLLIPAPFALGTGIVAVVEIQRHPKKHGMGRAIFGIVMSVFPFDCKLQCLNRSSSLAASIAARVAAAFSSNF